MILCTAHITVYVLMQRSEMLFLDSRSTQSLNAVRYLKQHTRLTKENMGVVMRNIYLLPSGGIWDCSEEVALNRATFLHCDMKLLFLRNYIIWKTTNAMRDNMPFTIQRVMLVNTAKLLYHRNMLKDILAESQWG